MDAPPASEVPAAAATPRATVALAEAALTRCCCRLCFAAGTEPEAPACESAVSAGERGESGSAEIGTASRRFWRMASASFTSWYEIAISSSYVLITASSLRAPPGALAWAWLNLNETSAGARMAAARSTAALPPRPAAVGPPLLLLPRVPMSPTSTESWSTSMSSWRWSGSALYLTQKAPRAMTPSVFGSDGSRGSITSVSSHESNSTRLPCRPASAGGGGGGYEFRLLGVRGESTASGVSSAGGVASAASAM